MGADGAEFMCRGQQQVRIAGGQGGTETDPGRREISVAVPAQFGQPCGDLLGAAQPGDVRQQQHLRGGLPGVAGGRGRDGQDVPGLGQMSAGGLEPGLAEALLTSLVAHDRIGPHPDHGRLGGVEVAQ
ncbi:hypothetical protein ACQ86D_18280 [Streptomyces galilaeus]